MGTLIYKDFIINRNNLLLLFFSILLISAMPLATLVGERMLVWTRSWYFSTALLFIFVYAMIAYIISMFMSAPFRAGQASKMSRFYHIITTGNYGTNWSKILFCLDTCYTWTFLVYNFGKRFMLLFFRKFNLKCE